MSSSDEISEFVKDPIARIEEASNEEADEAPRQRGAKRIPDCWTRVINLQTDDLDDLKIYPIATDLLLE